MGIFDWLFGGNKKEKEEKKKDAEIQKCVNTFIKNDATVINFKGVRKTLDYKRNIKPGKFTIIKVSDDINSKCSSEKFFNIDRVSEKLDRKEKQIHFRGT